MEPFSPEIQDAITEVFNVGIGQAACVLSELINDEILLTVPQVQILSQAEFIEMAEREWVEPSSIVCQAFAGPFSGDALLIFPADQSLELVRVLLAEPAPIETMTELEREALLEVGNIVLNACLSCIADLLEQEITNALPRYIESEPGALARTMVTDPDWQIIFIRIDFVLQSQNMRGDIAFVLDVPAAGAFSSAVEKLLQRFNAPT